MMTRSVFVSLLSAALFGMGGASHPTLAQNRTTSGTATLDAGGTVHVDNHEGSITVETWDRAEVRYEAVVRPEPDATHPEATVVRVERDDDRLALRTEYDESGEGDNDDGLLDRLFGGTSRNLMPVAYTLTVPRAARVEVDDHESDIAVQGLSGPVAIETHDGTIALTDQDGRAELDSHDGPIRVQNQTGGLTADTHDGKIELTGQDGDARIESHDGPIHVENHTGPVTIETHDSEVRLSSIEGRVRVDTHDSNIEADGLQGGLRVDTHEGTGRFGFAALPDNVDIATNGGDFTLLLPAGTGFDLRTDFSDEDARLRADFDLSPYRLSTSDDDDEVNYSGRVNGGGPRLSLSASDGDFEIRTQQ